jgi:hypothetical protein
MEHFCARGDNSVYFLFNGVGAVVVADDKSRS